MENDVCRSPGQKCLFPIAKSLAYRKYDDSKQAIQYFEKYLENKPDDLEVRWLLNLAYMTIGNFPGSAGQIPDSTGRNRGVDQNDSGKPSRLIRPLGGFGR